MNYYLIYFMEEPATADNIYNPSNYPAFLVRPGTPTAEKFGVVGEQVVFVRHLGGTQFEIIRRKQLPLSESTFQQLTSLGGGNGQGTEGTVIAVNEGELSPGSPVGGGLINFGSVPWWVWLGLLFLLLNRKQ